MRPRLAAVTDLVRPSFPRSPSITDDGTIAVTASSAIKNTTSFDATNGKITIDGGEGTKVVSGQTVAVSGAALAIENSATISGGKFTLEAGQSGLAVASGSNVDGGGTLVLQARGVASDQQSA